MLNIHSSLTQFFFFFFKSAPSGSIKSMVPMCRPFTSFSLYSCIHPPEEGAGIPSIMSPQPPPRGSYHKGTFMITVASGTATSETVKRGCFIFFFFPRLFVLRKKIKLTKTHHKTYSRQIFSYSYNV